MDPAAAVPAKPRVCAVSYLNTVPLVWGMLEGAQRDCFDLQFRLPAACADRLAAGAADIGILPSIEWARQGLELIRGTGIACRGAVRSILLITKVRPDAIRRLAADSSSRTSVALAQIILAERYGAHPHVITLSPYLPYMLETADAALLIGDPALRLDPDALPLASLDLGAEWMELTGLPMVFAVWGCRAEVMRPGLEDAFLDSCRFGRARIEEIVTREAPARHIPVSRARDYLTRHIVNEIGDEEYRGLERFLQSARRHDILVTSGGAGAS